MAGNSLGFIRVFKAMTVIHVRGICSYHIKRGPAENQAGLFDIAPYDVYSIL